jgi:hypothetical protein
VDITKFIKEIKYWLFAIAHFEDIIQKLVIKIRIPSAIVFVVVKEAGFEIMLCLLGALIDFKMLEKLFEKLMVFFWILF